jgi:hypothetical protein
LAWITESETEVDNPFSVVEAATAAVPMPMAALTHPDNARAEEIRRKVEKINERVIGFQFTPKKAYLRKHCPE